MSDISLSKAVRSNLLSLQNTADLMGKTQERLATGNKVNSALDNPTNFFTAASLNSRASDMNALMDSMSNGIQTLEAADNGLSAITKTLESMQSTLRQARQDKSFQTASYTVPKDGLAAGDTIDFSGGAVGATPVSVNLTKGTAGTSTTGTFASFSLDAAVDASAATASTITAASDFTDIDLTGNADNAYTFDVTLDGTTTNISLEQGDAADADSNNVLDIDEAIVAIQAQLDADSLDVTVGKDGNKLTFTANTAGATALTVDNFAVTGTTPVATAGDAGVTVAGQTNTGTDAVTAASADEVSFDIAIDGGTAKTVKLTAAQLATIGNGDQTVDDIDEYQALVQAGLQAAGVTGVTVGKNDDGTALTFTSSSLGTDSSVTITNGTATDNNSATALDIADAGLDALTEAGGDADGGDVMTTDELVNSINNDASLKGKIRASNDNGSLRIENQSTQKLDIDGVSSTGAVDGSSTGASSITGNSVRAGLADQFNELRDQLDKMADDASFNGINLLRGDTLTITFNETGTSSIDIHTAGEKAINSANLGVSTTLDAADLDSDEGIDAELAKLKTALNSVRSQSSNFGSNLSIVQNRQDFTKNMVNTLQTGAANLTLADTNEEAANLLALQTRQQLSSTALSMASQADQAVLRLF